MENKKHKLFNVFDLTLIGIAVILAAVLILSRFVGSGDDDKPAGPVVGSDEKKITYVVEFTLNEEDRDLIRVGDRVTDRIKHYNLGTVDSVEITDFLRYVPDFTTGKVVPAAVPGMVTARVTVTGSAVFTKTSILLDGGYPLYLGTNINAVFPEINVSGAAVYIERGQAQ